MFKKIEKKEEIKRLRLILENCISSFNNTAEIMQLLLDSCLDSIPRQIEDIKKSIEIFKNEIKELDNVE